MELFPRMKSKLIENVDKVSVVRQLDKPIKNTLKTLVKIGSYTKTSDIYNYEYSFDIPRASYDNLAQLYMKFTMSTGLADIDPASMLATKIMKRIILRTKRETTLQTLTPEYIQARIGELEGTPLYTKLEASIDSEIGFDASAQVYVYAPLFFFFSENESVFLNTRALEQLTLQTFTNDSSELMGMEDVDLTFLKVELFGLFHDSPGTDSNYDKVFADKFPRQITGSYNIFYEDEQVVSGSSTNTKFILRNPHPTFAMHIVMMDSEGNTKNINKIKITFGNREFLELDLLMNYTFYGSKKGYIDNNVFSYYFSQLKDRSVDSGLITFSKDLSPTVLELFYNADDPVTSDYTIKTMMEYRTNFNVSKEGLISISDDVEPFYEGQLSNNTKFI